MKINEIYKEPLTKFRELEKNFPEWDDITQFLLKYKFRYLGKGMYGSVYEHPNLDYILKIFDVADKGYIAFLKYAYNNHSQYLPKFRGKPMKVSENSMAVRMERLYKIKSTDKVFLITAYQELLSLQKENMNIYKSNEGYTEVNKKSLEEDINKNYPGLLKILDDLYEISLHIDIELDLGLTNIMERSNGDLVITDPIGGL